MTTNMKSAVSVVVALLTMSQMATATEGATDHVLHNGASAMASPGIIDVKIVDVRASERVVVQGAIVALPKYGSSVPVQSWHETAGKTTDGYSIVLTPTAEDEVDVDVVVVDQTTTTSRRAKHFKLPAGATDQLSMGNGFEVVLHRLPGEQGAGNVGG